MPRIYLPDEEPEGELAGLVLVIFLTFFFGGAGFAVGRYVYPKETVRWETYYSGGCACPDTQRSYP